VVVISWYALKGAAKVGGTLAAWLHVPNLWILESQAVAAGRSGHSDAMNAHVRREKTQTERRGRLVLALVVLVVVAVLAIHYLPWWVWPVAGAVAFVLLARHGKPDGRPLVRHAFVPPKYEPPTRPVITQALGSLNIPQINQVIAAGRELSFLTDPYQTGPGWGCQLDLPHGVTANQILAKRDALASGLRRPLSATWPEGVPGEHPGRLDLWIGFQDMAKVKAPPWPLLKGGTSDVFGSVPFGADPRGRPVPIPIFETNWLIGASPGQGKTAAVRVLACGVALDTLSDLWIHELAGKGDLDPLAKVCHRYCTGLDDEAIEYAAKSASLLKTETERRAARFKQLKGTSAMPDGKITRELAKKYRDLRPLSAVFDEVQNLLMHPVYGKQAAADLAYVIRIGRAMGITVILSTQRPNRDAVPTEVSGLIISRFCLMVPGQQENDMVLGTSSYKNGYNATQFRPKVDAGLGWLKGSEDGTPQVVKTYYLNTEATRKIAARARGLREAAGVLSGYALDEEGSGERDVIADVLAVFGTNPGLHWEVLAERLAQRFPDRWAGATADAVSAQLRDPDLGVPSVGVKMAGRNLQGCRRLDVEKAGPK
jgi:S-DNA-T family DNA segregation ATPase FtsK/SpoIIIE